MACKVCGGNSGYYPLCRNCFILKDEGKIEKCDICDTWHETSKPCNCKKIEPQKKETKDFEVKKIEKPLSYNEKKIEKFSTIIVDNEKPLTECILCKNEASGYLFCKQCYFKYKNKALLLKVTQCSEIQILDDSYEGIYTCKDGHIVKSKSERDIDNYLYDKNIKHAYEKALYVKSHGGYLHPDFYLPDYDVYIEHWGYDESNKEYTESKNYKLEKYREEKITLICTHEKTDAKDIDSVLDRKLDQNQYLKGTINFEND